MNGKDNILDIRLHKTNKEQLTLNGGRIGDPVPPDLRSRVLNEVGAKER